MKPGDVYRFKKCDSTNPDYWGNPIILCEINERFVKFRGIRIGSGDHFETTCLFGQLKYRVEEVKYDNNR